MSNYEVIDGIRTFPRDVAQSALLEKAGLTGRVYYVNKLTGSASNSGISWGEAMDEITTAIAASEVYRLAGGGSGTSTNDYVRNTIFVQGVVAGASYAVLTTLPSYCDIIGVGADATGFQMNGVPMIDGTSGVSAISATTQIIGLGLYNIRMQFGGANAYGIKSTGGMVNCKIENCHFAHMIEAGEAGLFDSGVFVGNTVRDCHFSSGSGGSGSALCEYGIRITSDYWGTLFERLTISIGSSALMSLSKTTPNNNYSRIHNCWFTGKQGNTPAIGLEVGAGAGYDGLMATENWFSKRITDPISVGHTDVSDCFVNNYLSGTTAPIYT